MNKNRVRGQKPYHLRKCGDKVRFPTYNDAWQSSRTIYKHAHEKMCAYQCPLCNDFHIGHQRSEDDLSTAFVPLIQHEPKKEPKQRKAKQPPPAKKQEEVMVYYPPASCVEQTGDYGTRKAIKKANREKNDRLRLLAIERKNQRAIAHAEYQRNERRGVYVGYMWGLAMDDGWNQHLSGGDAF